MHTAMLDSEESEMDFCTGNMVDVNKRQISAAHKVKQCQRLPANKIN
jgi:hypothetical protein